MASQAGENRTERIVVLMTPSEKAALVERARAHRLATGEFVRMAAESYDPGEDADMKLAVELMNELRAANERTRKSFERFEAELAAREDDATMRARIEAEVMARDDIDWDRLRAFLEGAA